MTLGRNTELKFLNNFYSKAENDIVVLYGKKSEDLQIVLKQFLKNKDYFYYSARQCSDLEQLYLFYNEMCENEDMFHEDITYTDIFRSMLAKKVQKRVIVINEFQDIVKGSPDFLEDMVRICHDKWNAQSVLFVLVSSSVSYIEKQMVEKIGDLAYEISSIQKVNELPFLELVRQFNRYKLGDCVETYAIIGGYPSFWKYWDGTLSVKENICKHVLTKGSYLYECGVHALPDEFREPAVYNTILLTLAEGKQKLNDIFKHTGFNRAKISVYLKNLIEMELVEKIDSYETAGKENAQKGIYRINDQFVHFWYRYVYANLSRLEIMDAGAFYDAYIAPTFRDYVSEYFTRVCTEYLMLMNQMKQLPFKCINWGMWVGKVGTIDIVAQDETGKTLVGLCNWEHDEMSYDDFEWLNFCTKQAKLEVKNYYLFSFGKFDQKLKLKASTMKNIVLIDSTQL